MEPTRELIDALYRERVLRARRTPIERKFLAGAALFEEIELRSLSGLRARHPDADEATLRQLLARRRDVLRRLRGAPHDGQ